jgi:hypothetical protein
MANLSQIPSNRVPFLDERTGLMSREWFIFFQHLNMLVGGGSNDASLLDLQVAPNPQTPMVFDEVGVLPPVYGTPSDEVYQQAQLIATVGQLQQTVDELTALVATQPVFPMEVGSFLLLE